MDPGLTLKPAGTMDRRTVVRPKDKGGSPLLVRPAFRPVGPLRADVDIAETNAALACDQVWGNRGLPGPRKAQRPA